MSRPRAIIIGGGIAGISAGAELAAGHDTVVLEREEHPTMHASGRSAAAFIPSYGYDNIALRELTRLSLPHLQSNMDGGTDVALLARRGLLTLVPNTLQEGPRRELTAVMKKLAGTRDVGTSEPMLRDLQLDAGYAQRAWYEPDVWDIDVNALAQVYLKRLRTQGGRLLVNASVRSIRRRGGVWEVHTASDVFQGELVVNCAGAWADDVAAMVGARRQSLTPMRRTAILFEPPAGCATDGWPVVYAADHTFYLKPDAGMLLASPADETPSPPMDAQPEEIDIATAAWRIEQAFDFSVRRISHTWAGLRTFAPDRTPTIGADPELDGFFWLAGQGGHGVQIAPAAARLLGALATDGVPPKGFQDNGFDPAMVSPARQQTHTRRDGE